MNNSDFVDLLTQKISQRRQSLPLIGLLGNTRSIDSSGIRKFDLALRQAKGIENKVEEILEIRLADIKMLAAFQENPKQALIAYIPEGDEKHWSSIEAFDHAGNIHLLNVYELPSQPVLLVGLDARKDMQAGLELLNEELQKAGMQSVIDTTQTREPLHVAKLDYIRLEDAQEPWPLGDAEIYMLVNGISTEAEKANIISLELPYLADEAKDYHPGQVAIVWKNYRYMAANINIYEHDDSTNYKEIAALLIKEIGNVAPEYQKIFDVASEIIRLMPDEWFTNDDDYIDVFYTLEMGKTYTNYYGASRNAKITLVPHTISGN